MGIFETPKQIERKRKDMKLYREYKRLKANPYNRATSIAYYLMKKHRIKSRSTIWKIVKRVEERLKIN